MKFAIIIVLAIVALLGVLVIGLPIQQESDLSERCARVLVAAAQAGKTRAHVSYSGAEVTVGSRQVRLSARIEDRKRAENKFLVAMAVDVFVDGVFQPLTVGSIGVGDTKVEAEDTAIVEWAQYVAFALVATLDSDVNSGISIEGFVAYPGLTGIRGSQVDLPKHVAKSMLGSLETLAPNLRSSGSELHSILIMVEVNQGKVAGGECRVDGVISSEALAAVRSFPWPSTQAGYIFKQFYILRRQ